MAAHAGRGLPSLGSLRTTRSHDYGAAWERIATVFKCLVVLWILIMPIYFLFALLSSFSTQERPASFVRQSERKPPFSVFSYLPVPSAHSCTGRSADESPHALALFFRVSPRSVLSGPRPRSTRLRLAGFSPDGPFPVCLACALDWFRAFLCNPHLSVPTDLRLRAGAGERDLPPHPPDKA